MILLDIDGVLNPFMMPNPLQKGYKAIDHQWGQWHIDPNAKAHLQRLSELDTLIWASTWEETSNDIMDALELPRIDWIPLDTPSNSDTLKLSSIIEWEAKNCVLTPLVWIEDELEDDAFLWAQNRPQTLLIHTEPDVGITLNDI